MKTKWLYTDVIITAVELIIVIAAEIAAWQYACTAIKQPFATLICIAATVVGLVLVYFKKNAKLLMRFDEKGFYFYGITGLCGFCAWEDIERVEYHKSKNNYVFDFTRRRRPVYISVYTKEHFIEPQVDENGWVSNHNIRGRKMKVNCDRSQIAWIIGINSGSKRIFKEFLRFYRPELGIFYNGNMLPFDPFR